MKKVILLAACTAAVLLSGCSDNELASVGDGIGTSTQSAIGFHVVGNQAETRATPITPSNITNTDFNVVAFKNNGGNDGELFMTKEHKNGLSGIIINYKNGKWDYADASDLHYWPKEGSLNFYAVSPATIAEGNTLYYWDFISNKSKIISYSCLDEYGTATGHSNPDVMYAIAKDYTQATKAGKVE